MPLQADRVASPILAYGDKLTRLEFLLDDEQTWGRVLFEKLDSLRVSRGEYAPCRTAAGPPLRTWVFVIEDSPWLVERHAYEARHYRDAYEFGGDVDEMLRDYSHYLFRFHDEFVEAIAAGIWMDSSPSRLADAEPHPRHPFHDLPESAIVDRFVEHGISCQVRRNPEPTKNLLAGSRLCSQKLYQFAAELDGRASVSWTLRIRSCKGRVTAQLCGYFGDVVEEFAEVPALEALRPRMRDWLGEVHARRREMGKA